MEEILSDHEKEENPATCNYVYGPLGITISEINEREEKKYCVIQLNYRL